MELSHTSKQDLIKSGGKETMKAYFGALIDKSVPLNKTKLADKIQKELRKKSKNHRSL